jgi:ribosome-associated toxin RatA of RatAB toxin-antitoxin module
MIRIERTILIQRPVADVYAFVTDMHSVRSWLPVSDIRPVSGGPMRVGATFAQTAEFMGRKFYSTIEVTQYEPLRIFAFKMIEGPFPLTNTMTFAPSGENATNLTLVGEAKPGNALKFLGPLVTPVVKKQLETQCSQLKKVLETRA